MLDIFTIKQWLFIGLVFNAVHICYINFKLSTQINKLRRKLTDTNVGVAKLLKKAGGEEWEK